MSVVFISYRRGDVEGQARALFNDLELLVGKNSVFMDVDNIGLGQDFRRVLKERAAACDMMLVLIGPHWADSKNELGQHRLDLPEDFVRIEIASALQRNIIVTPILLGGAQMPTEEQLPADLKSLAFRNAYGIRHEHWESDVRDLVKRLALGKKPVFTRGRILAGAIAVALIATTVFFATRKPVVTIDSGFTQPTNSSTTTLDSAASGVQTVPQASTDHRGPHTFAALDAPVRSLAVSPDGRHVLSGSGDMQLRLWDLASGKTVASVNAGGEVVGAAFSHDGERILSCSDRKNMVQLWTTALTKTQALDSDPILTASFSPSDDEVLSCGVQGATLTHVANGQSKHFSGGVNWCTGGALLDEDKAFLTGRGTNVVLWDFANDKEIKTIAGMPKWTSWLAIGPANKGHFLAVGSQWESTVRLYDYETGQELRELYGNTGNVNAVAFSPDGRTILSAGVDQTVRAWDRDTGEPKFVCRGHTKAVNCLVVTPDGKYVISGGDDGAIRVWDAATGIESK